MTNNDIKELTDFLDKYHVNYKIVENRVEADTVDLVNKSISKLPESIGNLTCDVLYLQYNQLTSLPASIVNLKCDYLYLYNNPLTSKLQHLFYKLKRNGVNVIFL